MIFIKKLLIADNLKKVLIIIKKINVVIILHFLTEHRKMIKK